MVGPEDIGQALEGLFSNQILGLVMKYAAYAFVAAILLVLMAVIYYLIQYKYKIVYPILMFDKGGQNARIVGFKKDRARDIRKDGLIKQHVLWKRKITEPFKEEDILPKNRVYLLKINEDGTYIPMPKVEFDGEISKFEQLTQEEKYWAVLQLKENAKTFASEDAHKKAMILTIVTVVFCLITAGVTVWLIMRSPQQIVSAFDRFGEQFISTAKGIGGIPPG